jgi:NAD(P)H dehydrogenase (quinone)
LHPAEHAGCTYDLGASKPFTVQQLADTIGATYQPMTLKELRTELDTAGLLPFQSAMLHSIHTAAAYGFLGAPRAHLEQILNRSPANPLLIAAATVTAATAL